MKKLDPLFKIRINPSDTQRSIRAYEVKYLPKNHYLSGLKKQINFYEQKDFYKIYIDFPKDILVKRIHLTKEMIKKRRHFRGKKIFKMKVQK